MANASPTDPTSAAAAALRITGEYLPVHDVEDPGLVMLGKARTYSANAGSYAPLVEASIAAILRIRSVMYDAMDKRTSTKGFMAGTGDDASVTWPASRERDLNALVVKQFQGPADGAADAAERALHELEDSLAVGRRKSEFVSLSIATSQDTLARVALIERELQTKSVQSVFDAFDTARTGDPELAKLLALAIEPWAKEKLATSQLARSSEKAATASATVAARETIGQENRMLIAILRGIEEFRVEAVDPSLVLASEIFAKLLLPAYRSFCGYGTAWDFPRTGPRSWVDKKLPDWSERLNGWLTRYMPFGRSDFATVDATTIAKRGGMNGPPGWGPRRKVATGWERQNIGNLLQNPDIPARLK